MKKRRHVRMFQPRFAPLVECGAKSSTIRKTPKREIRVGDLLDLRTWSGKPYRSKQIGLIETRCTNCVPISLRVRAGRFLVTIGEGRFAVSLFTPEVNKLATREGFANPTDMAEWFQSEHGLPFKGVLIEWQP